jgi:hypothetical protein
MQPLNLPYEFVDFLIKPGLDCDAGVVKLNQYMCKNIKNGGNANATALIGPLRWMKEGGKGTQLNKIVGGTEIDLILKGQGDPASFTMVWDFMCRNQEMLKAIKLEQGKNVYDLYFRGNRDAIALQKMVDHCFFGIDCVGFVANYLMYVGLWDKYQGFEISQWDTVFKTNIKDSDRVRPCQILLWTGFNHIAIVDWVHYVDGNKVIVDICQSSTGGPQCNERAILTRTTTQGRGNYQMFKIEGGTTNDDKKRPVPVGGHVYIMARKGFSYEDIPSW